jgi:Protein of unknown function with HXXEE motif
MKYGNLLFWAPLCAASLHIFEEFVFPGGFTEWYKGYRPEIQKSITTRFLVIINVALLVLCYDVGAMRSRPFGVAVWLTVTALLSSNAVWHVVGAVRTRGYSPGMLTGLLLYLPLTVCGYVQFLRGGASVQTAVIAFVIGGSYHLWSAAFHRSRGQLKT